MNIKTHFIVTGHIDHGKSTFIGRLLLELGAIAKDRFENLKMASAKSRLEYSHLTDALSDEKTKGITIGVSQTIFSHKNKEFVFIDAPGHHEFLQNMITGASRADIAFLLVDVVEGIKDSTLRHLRMLSFLGVCDIVVIINKMDLIDYSEVIFNKLNLEIKNCFAQLSLKLNSAIPVSAYNSENLVSRSEKMPWYAGPIVIDRLCQKAESFAALENKNDFRFVVHDIYENSVVGELLNGQLENNKDYLVHQSNLKIKITTENNHFKGEKIQSFILPNANSALKRGDIILNCGSQLVSADHFEALLIWFGSEKTNINDRLLLRLAKQEVAAQITKVSSLIDSSSLEKINLSSDISKGYVVKCELRTQKKISYDYFKNDPHLGRFIMLKSGLISGAGKIH